MKKNILLMTALVSINAFGGNTDKAQAEPKADNQSVIGKVATVYHGIKSAVSFC